MKQKNHPSTGTEEGNIGESKNWKTFTLCRGRGSREYALLRSLKTR